MIKKLLIMVILICARFLMADSSSSTFLLLNTGARPEAMGGAFIAVSGDVNSLDYNPAGIADISGREAIISHMEYIADFHYDSIVYCQAIRRVGTFGISIKFLYSNLIDKTGLNGEKIGTFSIKNVSAGLSYSRKFLDKLSFGFSLKYIYENYGEFPSSPTFALDFGALYNLYKNIKIGFSLRNAGGYIKFNNKKNNLPLITGLGISNIFNFLRLDLLVSMDANYLIIDRALEIMVGTELTFSIIAFRLGYNYNIKSDLYLSGLRMGIGIKFKFIDFSYCFVPETDEVFFTHRFSLILKFK